LLRVTSFFEIVKDRGGHLGKSIPCFIRKLVIVFFSIKRGKITFTKLLLVDHNNGIVGEAKVFLNKLDKESTGSFHNLVFAAVVCIEDKFVSYYVIGAVKTQLLGHIGGSNFETTVSGQSLIVN
jgi:hypothetical protein